MSNEKPKLEKEQPEEKLTAKEKIDMAIHTVVYPLEKLKGFKAWFMRKRLGYRTVLILRADGRVEEFLVKPKLGSAHIKIKDMVKTVKPDGWFIHKKLGPIAIYSEYSPDPITRNEIKLEGAITGQLLNSLLTEAYQLGKAVASEKYMEDMRKLILVNIGLLIIVLYFVWQNNTQVLNAIKQLASAIQKQTQLLQKLVP